jgi:hypothetical protein
VPDDVRLPNRGGRPFGTCRVSEPRHGVSVWLPASIHDRLIKLANRQEQSVSATLRELLIMRLR